METAQNKFNENKTKKDVNPFNNTFPKVLHNILDGTILTREKTIKSFPYLFFLTFLIIIYIANNYYAEKTIIKINKIEKENKELRYKYITVKSKLMFHTKLSEVAKKVKSLGLKESTVPPQKIFINQNK